jgi:carboxyl-terminal processing protease
MKRSGARVLSLWICQIACLFTVSAEEPELLKGSDIGRVMKQIFEQHVNKKEMSASILKNAFGEYINQFDPERVYLLEEEVRPFVQISDAEMHTILEQYKVNDYSFFDKLNLVIQHAIERARGYRKTLEQDPAQLFLVAKPTNKPRYDDWSDPDTKLPFAKNLDELQKRIKQHLILFVDAERRRYGESAIIQHESSTLAIYEKNSREFEDQYLYIDEAGRPLTAAQKENLFALHILKSIASTLDAHTSVLNPSEAYDMKVRLEKGFQGIGIALKQQTNGAVVVNSILENSPASKNGLIKVGDVLQEINGHSTSNKSFDNIMEQLRGSAGSTVSLVLQRNLADSKQAEPKIIKVELKRETITIDEDRVDVSDVPYGNGIIGKITLHSFYQGQNNVNSENDVREAIKKLDKEGNLRGLILDLRENSGGFLTQAVKVAGLFITNGVIVISKYSNGEEHYYRDMDGKKLYSGPLVVLTSKATASAAEIVAQALQDYGVALIVGDEHTYGKGTIQSQTVTENQKNSYFKVTVGEYYTVSGHTPQLQGVKADVVVASPFNKMHIGEEFLEHSLKMNTIPPVFDDKLADINPGLRPWYLRYYMPTLQHPRAEWRNMIGELRGKSAQRLSKNRDYETFMTSKEVVTPHWTEDDQMEEAVNIVKDMILLEASERLNQNSQVERK